MFGDEETGTSTKVRRFLPTKEQYKNLPVLLDKIARMPKYTEDVGSGIIVAPEPFRKLTEPQKREFCNKLLSLQVEKDVNPKSQDIYKLRVPLDRVSTDLLLQLILLNTTYNLLIFFSDIFLGAH